MKNLATIVTLAFLAGQAAGQCDLTKTRPNDANQGDHAGTSVSILDQTMAIGTSTDNAHGADAGAAHIMQRSFGSWKQVAKLNSKYAQPGDLFGTSVALAKGYLGYYALVGAPYADPAGVKNAGSVTMFYSFGDNGPWYEGTRLTIANYAEEDHAGCAVATDGAWAIIGAMDDDTIYGKDSGSASFVSISQFGDFTVQNKVGPTQGDDFDRFGCAVALEGQWAVVGASGGNANGKDSCGEVYVYRLLDGAWQAFGSVLTAPDGKAFHNFGYSVAVSGDLMAVGAPFADKDNLWTYAGAVYVFRFDGAAWKYETKFSGRGFENDSFGYRVAIAGKRVYASTINAGRIFGYEKVNGAWKKVEEIVDPDGPADGWFGSGLATDGATLAIGDQNDDYTILNLPDTGAAYTMGVRPLCVADFNGDKVLDIFDFLAFQNAFVAQEAIADMDCNGGYDLFDFLGFQNAFVGGCK